ncbi:MAG: D-alanyl-D-alanine carboxypeptidase, partial [Blautia obeum]|nr:D-alanyl-D-alanine carboxypeptidase [Blautia obeum]
MADKKRRNTPNTGNKRNNGRRKKKGRLKGLIAAELIVVVVLVMIVGHNLGLGAGITNFVNSIRKPAVEELDITGINSPYAVLMNAKSGKVIGDINGEEQMYPASMTKIMTTILTIENLKDLNQEITITNDMVADLYVQDAMQAGFQPNETVKAIDLLYGVMLPSGAECCVALADTVAGSVSDFVTLMNEKAEKLGMTNTHFSSISGLH